MSNAAVVNEGVKRYQRLDWRTWLIINLLLKGNPYMWRLVLFSAKFERLIRKVCSRLVSSNKNRGKRNIFRWEWSNFIRKREREWQKVTNDHEKYWNSMNCAFLKRQENEQVTSIEFARMSRHLCQWYSSMYRNHRHSVDQRNDPKFQLLDLSSCAIEEEHREAVRKIVASFRHLSDSIF